MPAEQPATDEEFVTLLTPCLQLVAPAGMSLEEQDTWLEAASIALAGVPADLLRLGARAALQTADHPSKIVRTIMDTVRPEMEKRKASAETLNRIFQGSSQVNPALPAPGNERLTIDEADAICRRYGVGRYSQHARAEQGGDNAA